MAIHGNYPQDGPATRHVRFKQVLLVDRDEELGSSIRQAISASPYLSRIATDIGNAVCSISRDEVDLVVVSSLVGDRSLHVLLRELEALPTPPPVLLLAYLHGESRWTAWRSLPLVSIVRTPFAPEDVLDAVRALIGKPWEERDAG
jgi:DNA-binding response OmpR family regulator